MDGGDAAAAATTGSASQEAPPLSVMQAAAEWDKVAEPMDRLAADSFGVGLDAGAARSLLACCGRFCDAGRCHDSLTRGHCAHAMQKAVGALCAALLDALAAPRLSDETASDLKVHIDLLSALTACGGDADGDDDVDERLVDIMNLSVKHEALRGYSGLIVSAVLRRQRGAYAHSAKLLGDYFERAADDVPSEKDGADLVLHSLSTIGSVLRAASPYVAEDADRRPAVRQWASSAFARRLSECLAGMLLSKRAGERERRRAAACAAFAVRLFGLRWALGVAVNASAAGVSSAGSAKRGAFLLLAMKMTVVECKFAMENRGATSREDTECIAFACCSLVAHVSDELNGGGAEGDCVDDELAVLLAGEVKDTTEFLADCVRVYWEEVLSVDRTGSDVPKWLCECHEAVVAVLCAGDGHRMFAAEWIEQLVALFLKMCPKVTSLTVDCSWKMATLTLIGVLHDDKPALNIGAGKEALCDATVYKIGDLLYDVMHWCIALGRMRARCGGEAETAATRFCSELSIALDRVPAVCVRRSYDEFVVGYKGGADGEQCATGCCALREGLLRLKLARRQRDARAGPLETTEGLRAVVSDVAAALAGRDDDDGDASGPRDVRQQCAQELRHWEDATG